MSSTTRRRRHSPAVYRRRRLVLVLLLLAIAAGVWLLIAQPWAGGDSAEAASPSELREMAATELPVPSSATPSPTAAGDPDAEDADAEDAASDDPGASASPSPNATPIAAPCVERDITVEAVTDKGAYASGENPQLSIRLTNDGEADCTLNVGTTTQVFTVTSGSDTWWRSTDCQAEPSDMVVTLAEGQTVSSATPLEWDRTRSAVGTCDSADRPRAAGNGATYWLDVEIGGITAIEAVSFQLF